MGYLGRKFTLAKWSELENSVCADGVTYCLRTSGNTLSFWKSENLDNSSIEDIVLAFVANGDKVERLDIILLDEQFFDENELSVENTDGNTKVEDLIKNHRDVVSLNIRKLEILSSEILQKVKEYGNLEEEVDIENYPNIRRFTVDEIKNILNKAIDDKRISEDSLSSKLLAKLK